MSGATRVNLPLAALACTLTTASGAAQMAAWRRLHAEFSPTVERSSELLTVQYPDGRSVHGRFTALVEIERRC